MKVTTAQWMVHRPVNRDAVYVCAVRYVLDTAEDGWPANTQVMTPEGEWETVGDGAELTPTLEINGRDFHLNRDAVVEQIQELCETLWASLLEERSAGEVTA